MTRLRRGVAIAAAVLLALAGCAPTPAPPTMAEVLDGPEFAAQRDASVQQVQSLMESMLPSAALAGLGVEPAGSWVSTDCMEGQNNWKVRDGYRLSCSASEVAHFAWDGKFESGQMRIQRAVSTWCSGARPVKPETEPLLGAFNTGPGYACKPADIVAMEWAVPKSLDYGSGGAFDRFCGDVKTRCGLGTPTSDIRDHLAGHGWVVRVTVVKTYYED